MSTDLSALRARVEGATGPDREIDAAILHALARPRYAPMDDDEPDFVPLAELIELGMASPYTASLDAALGLVEAKLPGWWWSVKATGLRPPKAFFRANIFTATDDETSNFEVLTHTKFAATPALALISALLSALETQ